MKNYKTNTLLLIKPSNFGFNPQTESTNAFQKRSNQNENLIHQKALDEFNKVVYKLKSLGINLIVLDDTPYPVKPDAIFPNNWVSFHPEFNIIYPMQAENRRLEKRMELLTQVNTKEVVDLSYFESKNQFLEGTGSMVFDYENKIIYASISPRTHIEPLETVAEILHYSIVTFKAETSNGSPIYHTNVMLCIAKKYAIVCFEAISSKEEVEKLRTSFIANNQTIIEISKLQMSQFAGNMLEVFVKNQSILIMSLAAYRSLNKSQINQIETFSKIETFEIPTIEFYGGGSIRCMLAQVF